MGPETEDEDDDLTDEDVSDLVDPEEDRTVLSSGEALDIGEVDEFLRWRAARFVTLIGERDSGKTTLLFALYDRFLRGNFKDYFFSGSRTLIGLEKRSHHSRADSGRDTPDTSRTSMAEGLRYYHFAVTARDGLPGQLNLMISDRAGERYQKARDNSLMVQDLIEVTKGDYIVLLLDGGRLADPFERAGAMQKVRQTIRAFLDGGALSKSSHVQIVTTKIDLLVELKKTAAFVHFFDAFQQRLQTDFIERLGSLSFCEISARDPRNAIVADDGIERLFASWCISPPNVSSRLPLQITLTNEFDRLLSRTPLRELI